ncbi:MAG: M42 family peptidase [Oscillospiraceae bacterium]|nr:M42 family peptidase [Oscillospiraceae bacterium]
MQYLKELSDLYGVSGFEDNVRDYICTIIKGKCEYHIDNLGDIIAFKQGRKRPAHKIMVAAHMDEVGMIATYICDNGTIKFDTVGGINADVIAGRQVVFCSSGITGAVGMKAVHHLSRESRKKPVSKDNLYIDIGASSRQEAEKYVRCGDYISFCSDYFNMGNDIICGKALDDRAGCAVMLSMIESDLEYDTYFAFNVQEEVGLRGAAASAYSIDPDFAVVLEATTASDISGVTGHKRVCVLGQGPAVSFMDRRTIYDREMYNIAFETAKANSINCQTKTMVAGGNDSGVIHTSRSGVRTLAVSVPCRYLHSPHCIIKRSDLLDMKKLTMLLIQRVAVL